MEELMYNLNAIVLIRKAVSQCYGNQTDIIKMIECISLIDEVEENIVNSYLNLNESID